MKKIHVLLFTYIILIFVCCNNQSLEVPYVENKMWIYLSGERVANLDVLNLRAPKYFFVSHDTIFFKNKAIAQILKIDKENYELTVKSLSNNLTGTYSDINKPK
jgi:hypothetical protein